MAGAGSGTVAAGQKSRTQDNLIKDVEKMYRTCQRRGITYTPLHTYTHAHASMFFRFSQDLILIQQIVKIILAKTTTNNNSGCAWGAFCFGMSDGKKKKTHI